MLGYHKKKKIYSRFYLIDAENNSYANKSIRKESLVTNIP